MRKHVNMAKSRATSTNIDLGMTTVVDIDPFLFISIRIAKVYLWLPKTMKLVIQANMTVNTHRDMVSRFTR